MTSIFPRIWDLQVPVVGKSVESWARRTAIARSRRGIGMAVVVDSHYVVRGEL